MFSSHHSSNPLSPREYVTHLVITEDAHAHTILPGTDSVR